MPELPEVQTVVNQIKPILIHKTVESITPVWPKVFHNFTSEKAQQKIKRGRIIDVSRRAKFIIIKFTENIIAIHLRMTGKLYLLRDHETLSKYTTAYFTLKNGGKLIFDDVRKFGRIYLYKNTGPIDERHGPEPLEKSFTSKILINLIKSKKRNIKALLLDQSMIAGLGNIYADESLWKSKIHPNSLSHKIPKKRIENLYKNIKIILTNAIEQNGTTIIDFSVNGKSGKYTNELKVYGKRDIKCFNCNNHIIKIRVAGRGTYICSKCQKKYK
ncbi:MAG: DNA-formamidopyrimidine glycosylase [Candidatus Marinimicrobia bacterium]|nr:DNA-formamidopyrimidine glycosylase [Candidatus Neomarinimicrobiota bacterium]|tara:strand:+ start:788 stop:1603 length:816 start_codon:yes stop_codon:yes gene_type:complete